MDVNNGILISDLIINFNEQPKILNSPTPQKNLVLPDYFLLVLRDSQKLGITVVALILCTVAVAANIATIIVNIRRKIRPFLRICLLSLACSDLLTSVFQTTTYVSQLSNEFVPLWTLGELMCGFIPFITTLAILVNSFTLVGIAVDRYLAVVRWISGTWEPNKYFCYAGVVFVWGLAAGISSPMISSYYIVEFYIVVTDPSNHSHYIDYNEAEMCTSEKISNQYYYSVVFFVIFLPLLIAFLWLNSILAKEIFSKRRPITATLHAPAITVKEDQSGEKRTSETNTVIDEKSLRPPAANGPVELSTSTSSQTNYNAEKKPKTSREIRQLRMFKAILVIMITFFVCRLPAWIVLLYKLFNVANTNFHWMLQYCLGLLSITNCVLNPFLYTFLTEAIQYSFVFASRAKMIMSCGCFKSSDGRENPENNRI